MAKGKYQRWLEPDGLTRLEGWARDGLTDEQIVQKMGIGIRTLYEWKEKYPQISQALKEGKEIVDTKVESALLKRALGYEYLEKSVEVTTITRGKTERRVRQVTKTVLPDVTAQIFWLKNRRGWSDKPKEGAGDTSEVQIIDDI